VLPTWSHYAVGAQNPLGPAKASAFGLSWGFSDLPIKVKLSAKVQRTGGHSDMSMPTGQDALGLWGVSATLSISIGLCIRFGKAPGISGYLKRSEQPGAFWTAMAISAVGLFVLVFLAIYASVPWAAMGW
jgi:predicted alpha/beta hydrolase